MVNKKKQKGTAFETLLVKMLNEKLKGANVKRTPGSGSFGTIFNEATISGDIVGKITNFYKPLKIECKSGYNTLKGQEVKSFSLKKEWLDKVREESVGNYSLPLLAGKFDNVKSGVKYFVVFDIDTFIDLINYTTDLKKELDLCYEEVQKCKKTISGSG